MPSLQPGDPAPQLAAETHTGRSISLSELRGEHVVVVYFYPMDGTALCTREACAFRDAYEEFAAAGAVVIGVSADTLQRHQTFAQRQALPFYLVSDRDGTWRNAFGVPKTWGVFPGRVTYVIDREGVVRHVFNAQFTAEGHVKEALAMVRKLAQEPPPA